MSNPTNQGAVDEDDTVSDYATIHEDAETTPVMSTSASNDGEWLFNGSILACFFANTRLLCDPWFSSTVLSLQVIIAMRSHPFSTCLSWIPGDIATYQPRCLAVVCLTAWLPLCECLL